MTSHYTGRFCWSWIGKGYPHWKGILGEDGWSPDISIHTGTYLGTVEGVCDEIYIFFLCFSGRLHPEYKVKAMPWTRGEQWQWVWISADPPKMHWPELDHHQSVAW